MAEYTIAHAKTRKNEGGYANNPLDRGKETYAGIARNFWPSWPGWTIIDAVKAKSGTRGIDAILAKDVTLQGMINSFYKVNFWDVNRLDAILNQELANTLFDIGVNSGTGTAAKTLQEALNLSNANGQAYPDILVDGQIGPKTVQYTNGHYRPELLYKLVIALQWERYIKIMRNNPSQEAFAASWFSRAF